MVDQLTTFFNEVYDRTYDTVARYVISKCSNTDDIADIIQETYTELYAVLAKKGPNYIKDAEAFTLGLAKRRVYKHYSFLEKVKKQFSPFAEREPAQADSGELQPVEVDAAFVNRATIGEIWSLLKSRPQLTQKIFYLYYYCDLTLKEIAAELNLHESNVKHRLYRTLAEIRKFYGKEAN
ncbi:MAG: sigma-70 family RNA polymerase sigma factor [Firmicutes bacterium]|nr:sigma-70 family RNA polymerase sigma factor [Bacillota bacterium]HOB35694.1 sigma-70 family RNA polymerase sigma factor [Bacillota bacterium]HPZ90406.1 sigma-70 family RNA polymerase sigma factor [Bacillota bacterium]HQE02504.1 sigma-70 family RNA polymerase sigma factor [Bacillota bacterium]